MAKMAEMEVSLSAESLNEINRLSVALERFPDITLLDLFAGLIAGGLSADPDWDLEKNPVVAYNTAEAMLAEKAKRDG